MKILTSFINCEDDDYDDTQIVRMMKMTMEMMMLRMMIKVPKWEKLGKQARQRGARKDIQPCAV